MISLLTLAAAATPDAEPTLLGLDAEGWVYVGITIFFVLAVVFGKAHHVVTRTLDAHIAEARRALDEAAAIRAEAESLLADARRRYEASSADATAMLHHARAEADSLLAKAESDTAQVIARRERMAADKIATAERAAVEHLRARAASAAIGTATDIIAATHDVKADRSLVDEAIAAL